MKKEKDEIRDFLTERLNKIWEVNSGEQGREGNQRWLNNGENGGIPSEENCQYIRKHKGQV